LLIHQCVSDSHIGAAPIEGLTSNSNSPSLGETPTPTASNSRPLATDLPPRRTYWSCISVAPVLQQLLLYIQAAPTKLFKHGEKERKFATVLEGVHNWALAAQFGVQKPGWEHIVGQWGVHTSG
jgi:hypothetical protein